MNARFIAPLKNLRGLLWEIGYEDVIIPVPQISPMLHGDLHTNNILIEIDDEVLVWLIDFNDAKSGHIYFDLAKLEVGFRRHVFYELFNKLIDENILDETSVIQLAMLIENALLQVTEEKFEDFIGSLRNYQSDWYEKIYTRFPIYFENLLYFLYRIRTVARSYNPDRFKYHYPVAVFFHSLASLKYEDTEDDPWYPWGKRLSLYCAQNNRKSYAKFCHKIRYQSRTVARSMVDANDCHLIFPFNRHGL